MIAAAGDLHIHTALSPCAEDAMTPRAIVLAAAQAKLDIIAVCDHNSAGNAAAVQEAAQRYTEGRVAVLAGIEINTAEEVHLVGLFPDADAAECVGDVLYATLPKLPVSKRRYGEQLIMNADGGCIGREMQLLSIASAYPLADAVALVRDHGGLAIAAHADRPSFSVTSQLGFFPPGLRFDAVEVSAAGCRAGRQDEFMPLGMPLITASDAHSIEEIGVCRTLFALDTLDFESLAAALHCDPREGRCVIA